MNIVKNNKVIKHFNHLLLSNDLDDISSAIPYLYKNVSKLSEEEFIECIDVLRGAAIEAQRNIDRMMKNENSNS